MNETPVSGSLGDADDSKPDADVGLSRAERHQRWQSKRPPIEHLKDGIAVLGDGSSVVLFDVGDRIVVDTRTSLLKGLPWLETIVGRVRSIDDDTGMVSLYDEDSDFRSPRARWASFKDGLACFKLAPAKGSPFIVTEVKVQPTVPQPGKRGKGRPKGTKNRPKAVIEAEKAAKKGRAT